MQAFEDHAYVGDVCGLLKQEPCCLDQFVRSPDEDFEFALPFDLAELLADDFQGSVFAAEECGPASSSPGLCDATTSSHAASAADSAHSSPSHEPAHFCSAQLDSDMQALAAIVLAEPVSQVVRRACTSGPKLKAAQRACTVTRTSAHRSAMCHTSCLDRKITTDFAPSVLESVGPAPAMPHITAAAPLLPPRPKPTFSPPPVTSRSEDHVDPMDSDDSDDTEDAAGGSDEKQHGVGSKRKAPEIDWRSITDPVERRRQRRLAKNRVTAARSRERKKSQWADMEQRFSKIENENSRLRQVLEHLAAENAALKSQLHFAAVAAAAAVAAGPRTGRASGPQTPGNNTEPAVLVFIATLLLTCCFLSGDKALLLGSCVPLLLAALLACEVEGGAAAAAGGRRRSAADVLLRFLMQLHVLLSACGKPLRKAVSAVLYGRRRYLGRQALARAAQVASAWWADTCGGDGGSDQEGMGLSLAGGGGRGIPTSASVTSLL